MDEQRTGEIRVQEMVDYQVPDGLSLPNCFCQPEQRAGREDQIEIPG